MYLRPFVSESETRSRWNDHDKPVDDLTFDGLPCQVGYYYSYAERERQGCGTYD